MDSEKENADVLSAPTYAQEESTFKPSTLSSISTSPETVRPICTGLEEVVDLDIWDWPSTLSLRRTKRIS